MTGRQRPEAISSDRELAEFLLGSARDDAPAPEAVDAAWARFAHSMLAAGARVSASSPDTSSPAPPVHQRLRRAAVRWFTAGAIGGSMTAAACFAGWYQLRERNRAPEQVVGAASTSAMAPGDSAEPSRVPVQPLLDLHRSVASTATAIAAPIERGVSHGPPSAAKLAEQVALLDAVGNAVAQGATDEALRLVAQYHQRFPHGSLAADAEALAIQALAKRGDQEAARERARRFLKQYPNDPHAGSLRAIAEGAARQ